MSPDRRDIPERREMDVFGNVFKRHWGKILIATFTLGGIWATLQGQISDHSKSIIKLTADDGQCHDFMVSQTEVNKTIDSIDRKLDRLLRR